MEKLGTFLYFLFLFLEMSSNKVKIHVCGQLKASKRACIHNVDPGSTEGPEGGPLMSVQPKWQAVAFCHLEEPNHRCSALPRQLESLKYFLSVAPMCDICLKLKGVPTVGRLSCSRHKKPEQGLMHSPSVPAGPGPHPLPGHLGRGVTGLKENNVAQCFH